jgi:CRP/FNR family transcriptional regulator, dissimilatory nitrate respiration regulator
MARVWPKQCNVSGSSGLVNEAGPRYSARGSRTIARISPNRSIIRSPCSYISRFGLGSARLARAIDLPRNIRMSMLDWLPATVRDRCAVRDIEAGRTLFRQGDKSVGFFEVERGHVRLIRHTADGRPVILHSARAGDLFAEAALFSTAYQCDAVAALASRVRVYPKRPLPAVFRRDPAVAENFMAVLAHEIHGLRARLEERNIRSARDRLLHHLALVAGRDGRTVTLDGTLMDLASEIGLAHEVLYRTLAALEKDGAIRKTRSKIVLRRGRAV